MATWALHDHLKGSDVTWFIDNEAAAAAGIRGASGEPDVTAMVQAAHLLWLNLGTRVWIEWIDSASNPADGLSRAGLHDPWTQTLGWELAVSTHPPWSSTPNSPYDLFQTLWKDIG